MRTRVIILTAVLMWLAAGLCLAGDRPEIAPGNETEAFDFDSGTRPCDMIFAQGPGQGPGPRGGMGGRHGKEWKNRRKHLEQLRTLKMLEVLDLAEDQEVEFLTAFKAVRKEHGLLNAEKETLIDSLSGLLKSGDVDGSAINSVVDRVLGIEDTVREVKGNFIKTIRDLLTPEQLARFVVFNDRFERQLLEQVKSFRERKGRFSEPPVGKG